MDGARMTDRDYEIALDLLHTWTKGDSLRRHAYAVEAAMAEYARIGGADEYLWRITGLLHDMDYDKHPTPEEHPFVGIKALRELGSPEEMLEAILGHAKLDTTQIYTQVSLRKLLDTHSQTHPAEREEQKERDEDSSDSQGKFT